MTKEEITRLVTRLVDSRIDAFMERAAKNELLRQAKIMAGKPSLEELSDVVTQSREWLCYYAMEHDDPKVREWAEQAVIAVDNFTRDVILPKAEKLLERERKRQLW
jgi:hypothetical protein